MVAQTMVAQTMVNNCKISPEMVAKTMVNNCKIFCSLQFKMLNIIKRIGPSI